MTDLMVKLYVRGKIIDFIRKTILSLELTEKGKKGVEKMETLLNGFWDKAEKFIIEEQKRDLEFIPDVIEKFAEDTLLEALRLARNTLNIRNIAQEIFDISRAENIL